MSSVSMSGVGQNLFQYLRSLSANGSSPTAQTGQTAPAGQVDSDGDNDGSGGVRGASSGGRHHHGNSALFQAIQKSVTDALNAASSSGSSGTTPSDPNTVIEQAIAKVLTAQGSGSTGQTGATPPAGTQGTTNTSNSTDAASRQAFFQLLKDNGIDPQQFRQDFMAAIKDAQGGQANPSTAFQSFPPGTLVNTTA